MNAKCNITMKMSAWLYMIVVNFKLKNSNSITCIRYSDNIKDRLLVMTKNIGV